MRMRKAAARIAAGLVVAGGMLGGLAAAGPALGGEFRLTSTDMAEGAALTQKQVFNGFGCSGQNISPQLSWSGAPAGTKSFVVTAYDPDAPTGSGWWHWVVYNIPADATGLPANAAEGRGLPAGAVQARNDFGTAGFGGACPPPGEVHRYEFRVFALGVERLDVDPAASPALIGFMTRANALGVARLTAVYTR